MAGRIAPRGAHRRQSDESVAPFREALRREDIRALSFVPLALHAGVLGKFMLYYSVPHESTAEELDMAQAIGIHIALAAEQTRIEQARVRTEAHLQHSTAVRFLKDREGRYILLNRQCEESFGSDVLGRTDADVFPPDQAGQYRAHDLAVMAAERLMTFEERGNIPDVARDYAALKFPLTQYLGRRHRVGRHLYRRHRMDFRIHRGRGHRARYRDADSAGTAG